MCALLGALTLAMSGRNCQHVLWPLLVLLMCGTREITGLPTAEAEPSAAALPDADADAEARRLHGDAKFVQITEDVIPDVANTTQKVIRVNPLDLPAIREDAGSMDSSLYKIQSLLPAHRSYVNSNRMRKVRPDSAIVKGLSGINRTKMRKPKQHVRKQLHFLYNQPDWNGLALTKQMNVHVAPGAYPVYYAVAKTNGRFGKTPIKGFRNEAEFLKYLAKAKLVQIQDNYLVQG